MLGPRPESKAICVLSASLYRRSENVIIDAIIVPELEPRNIEREIFATDLVVATDDAALEDTPEALNRVRAHRANHVPLGGVVDAPLFLVKYSLTIIRVRSIYRSPPPREGVLQ